MRDTNANEEFVINNFLDFINYIAIRHSSTGIKSVHTSRFLKITKGLNEPTWSLIPPPQ